VAFLLVLVGGSLYAARFEKKAGESVSETISGRVQAWFPILLALALCVVGASLVIMGALYGWTDLSLASRHWQRDTALGICIGALIACLYFTVLSPALTWAQARLGDYVPPGSVLETLEGQLPYFFIANILLAPLVEELWFRGALYSALSPLGPGLSILLTSIAFGLFHWPGGAWYMLLTGGLLGSVLGWLRLEQAGLLAPYAAHLTLNIIEFYVLARRNRKAKRTTFLKYSKESLK